MRTTFSVIAMSLLLALGGCANWSGKKTGTTDGAAGTAGYGSVEGDESSIGYGPNSEVGNQALDRGTGDTR